MYGDSWKVNKNLINGTKTKVISKIWNNYVVDTE